MNHKLLSISPSHMQAVLQSILLRHGFAEEKAFRLAEVFTTNSLEGVITHGINRFPLFVEYVREGIVRKAAEPEVCSAFGSIEQWDGCGGAGPLNAIAATDRAMTLASRFGIGCVALARTNHWMRGGYYGWQAARKGYVLLAWTNTVGNMPAWGAIDSRLGNNPLVIALPYGAEAVVLDMAMSQYSFGAMEAAAAQGSILEVPAGYDKKGQLSSDPAAIMASRRPLPIGYWKGAGLSLLLDMLACILSGGLATHDISARDREQDLSQVFICIDPRKLQHHARMGDLITSILDDYRHSKTETGVPVRYPGEQVIRKREQYQKEGIPVLQSIWEKIEALHS
jgi:3-dehydro-L-gulonate 2-dehydrogenase